jgi:hypothetical protein
LTSTLTVRNLSLKRASIEALAACLDGDRHPLHPLGDKFPRAHQSYDPNLAAMVGLAQFSQRRGAGLLVSRNRSAFPLSIPLRSASPLLLEFPNPDRETLAKFFEKDDKNVAKLKTGGVLFVTTLAPVEPAHHPSPVANLPRPEGSPSKAKLEKLLKARDSFHHQTHARAGEQREAAHLIEHQQQRQRGGGARHAQHCGAGRADALARGGSRPLVSSSAAHGARTAARSPSISFFLSSQV